jgi:hypothetical protein
MLLLTTPKRKNADRVYSLKRVGYPYLVPIIGFGMRQRDVRAEEHKAAWAVVSILVRQVLGV